LTPLNHYQQFTRGPIFGKSLLRFIEEIRRMKQPDEPAIGTTRKTLPARKSRKAQKSKTPAGGKAARRKNILDKNVEQELVRVFGEK
jgi:hypothetical protein